MKVTAAIIVKDEEIVIERCIKSVIGLVDEVLIYDTGSTDETQAIAEKAGGTVKSDGPWEKFRFDEARNRAAELAAFPWIFVIDADEVVYGGGEWIKKDLAKADGMGMNRITVLWQQKATQSMVRTETPRLYQKEAWKYRFRIHNELTPQEGCLDKTTASRHVLLEHLPQETKEAPRFAQTVELLEEAVKDEPDHIDAHRYLAEAYIRTERFKEAALCARRYIVAAKTVRSSLDISEGWCFLARAHARSGESSEAIAAFETASSISPIRREPLWEAAHFWGTQGEWTRACDCLRRLLKIPLRAKPLYFAFTWDPVWTTMPQEALRVFEKESQAQESEARSGR